MKKILLLAVTAIVIAAVLFFGVKAIKATPKAEAVQELNASVTTSVSPTATPAPVTTVTPTATPKPATPTATPTTTPVPATEEAASESTSSEATASEATPADPAEAFIESLCDSGIHAEEIPAMAREEKGGFLKSVKLGDSALTTWTALDLPLGEEPEWEIPTRAGKPIIAGWAYMTRRAATVLNVVPDWYCVEHKAARWSCQTTSEDYTLYKGDVASEALKAFRLVRVADGFEWRLALCECGVTEKISGGPGGSSPTKKPTTPPTPPSENEPTEPDHPPYEGVDDADHPPKEGITGDSSEQENIGGADSDTNESHGSLEGVGGDEEPKARRSSKKSFFND